MKERSVINSSRDYIELLILGLVELHLDIVTSTEGARAVNAIPTCRVWETHDVHRTILIGT